MTLRTRLGAILGRLMEAMLGAPDPMGLDDPHWRGMGHSGAVTTARKPEPPVEPMPDDVAARISEALRLAASVRAEQDARGAGPRCYCAWCRE
jgi:hypothetical protein